jgi:hypothetical protein
MMPVPAIDSEAGLVLHAGGAYIPGEFSETHQIWRIDLATMVETL